jgi:gamma-glutamyltranspeptidase/glutathione hydrolase
MLRLCNTVADGDDVASSPRAQTAAGGMVSSSHPEASKAGVDILKAGGNAADGALAAAAMMNMVKPASCGVGGDAFAILYMSDTNELRALNANGRSPYGLSREHFVQRGITDIGFHGWETVSVPGAVAGWQMLRDAYGTMTLKQLLAPAIEMAEDLEPSGPAGSPDLFQPRDLARTLAIIAEGGEEAYYRGEIARRIVEFSDGTGGFFSLQDFAEHKSQWVQPISTTYRGNAIYECPPPGQGISVLEMLNILEGFDLKAIGHNSAQYLNLLIEAKRLAFADLGNYVADPSFRTLPMAGMVSKQYGAAQRKRIVPGRALPSIDCGNPRDYGYDTAYISVVDRDRNACSFMCSNFSGWGSQVAVEGMGIILQNRGRGFSLKEGHLNIMEPHKRPFHTIIPAMMFKDGRPVLVFGAVGGPLQPQAQIQVLMNIIEFGMDPQQAIDAPRFAHYGGNVYDSGTDTIAIRLGKGIPQSVCDELVAMGYELVDQGGFGEPEAIMIDYDRDILLGGSCSDAVVGYDSA